MAAIATKVCQTPTELGVVGSARPTFKLLLDKVAVKSDKSFFDNVTRERHRWDDMLNKQADLQRSKDRIHPQAVARAASDLGIGALDRIIQMQ